MKANGFESGRGLAKVLWLSNLLFALALCGVLWVSYQQQYRHATERAENTALTLERSVSGLLDQINLMLVSVQDELESELLDGRIKPRQVDPLINRLVGHLPGIKGVRYSDAGGLVLAGTGYPAGKAAVSYLERDYFIRLRDEAKLGMTSSKPVIGKSHGAWVIVFARAYRHKDGSFAGVVVASVELEQFAAIFAALKVGARAHVALIDHDFAILASCPLPKDLALLGRRVQEDAIVAHLKGGLTLRTAVVTSKTDGVERLYSLRKLASRPYWIGVGLSTDDELAKWRNEVGIVLLVMLAFALLTGAAGRQLQRDWRAREADRAVLESTLEATDDGILVVSAQGRVLHANHRFAAMWGLPEELIARGDDQVLLDRVSDQLNDPQAFRRGVEALYVRPDAEGLDMLEFKDGRVFERDSLPMLIDGKPAGRVWSFRDVSQRKRVETLLGFIAQRQWGGSGQGFLPALAERLGQLLKVDYALIDKLGDEPGIAETVGLYAHGAVVPNLRYHLTGTPCENVIGKELCVYRRSIQQLFPDDGLLVEMKAESYIGLPLWDSSGQPIGLITIIHSQPLQEIDQAAALLQMVAATAGAELERQREERKLRRERDRAQSYLDTVEAMLVVLDGEGRIALINRKGYQLLDWPDGELIGRSWFDTCLLQPEGREKVFPHFLKIIAGEIDDTEYFENEVLTRRGERRHIAWHNALLRDDEQRIVGILSAGGDITERKLREQELEGYRRNLETLVDERTHALTIALQQAEAANRAKSVFLSNMSHELRTPLNAVIGFSRLMSKSATLSEGEKKNLAIINRSGEHLLTLINDVLELSKIDAGRVEMQEEACDVGRLAQDVADMLRPRAEQAGLHLRLAIDGVPAALRVDTTKLRQILINLLSNAVKFTARGSVGLSVEGSPVGDREVRLDFEISDPGIGIAAEDQQRIFDPFVQIVTDATSAGTGLGLTITRQYLHMLGSELSVESTPGQGSSFRFPLRLPLADAATVAADNGDVFGLSAADCGKRILVVEDDPDSRQLLYQLLNRLGFVVAEAVDGLEAVAQVGSFHPELIIMDWRMRNLDGLEATRRIRAQGAGNPVKILMLSASVFEEQKREALAAGVDDFLRKPLQEDELYAALESHLGVSFERGVPVTSGAAIPADAEPTAAEMAVLPEALRAALREAAAEANPGKIKAVLAAIEPEHPQLARGLARIVETFRYQELWSLLRFS